MKFYNILDDQNRFIGLKVYPIGNGQYDSHSVSYLYARSLYKQMSNNEPIGLELGNKSLKELLADAEIELQRINLGTFFHMGCNIHTTNNLRNCLSGCIQLVKCEHEHSLEEYEVYDLLKECMKKVGEEKIKILKKINYRREK